MNPESIWILLGVLFLGGAIGFYASRKPRPSAIGEERLRGNYLAGVNFLVNEQPDRALEAFLRAAELDDETVETHFALGSLYRRRGEVDRAIKIHQNIATRESLEPNQREQAGFALAQDYLKAGLLDRAEKILQPLAASGAHRMAAMRKLMRIYEQEQEWMRAIEVFRELEKAGRAPQESAIAHYYCELAEAARERGELDEARAHLRAARSEVRRFPRGALVRADIAIEQRDYPLAERLLGAVLAHDAALAIEVVPRLVRLARAVGSRRERLPSPASSPDAQTPSMKLPSLRSWRTPSTSLLSRSACAPAWPRTTPSAGLVAGDRARSGRARIARSRRHCGGAAPPRGANAALSLRKLRILQHRPLLAVPGMQDLGQPAATASVRPCCRTRRKREE